MNPVRKNRYRTYYLLNYRHSFAIDFSNGANPVRNKSTHHYTKKSKVSVKKSEISNGVKVIGITGGFKTGKSTVTHILSNLGARVIDTDKLAHRALLPGTDTYKKIVKEFGKRILNENDRIDRKKLAGIVFNDNKKLKLLNNIVHPYVKKELKKRLLEIKRDNPNAIVVVEVPLLFEAGMEQIMDKIIVVSASENKQIERAKKDISLSEDEIKKRIEAQMPMSKKKELADLEVDNNGSIEKTKRQIEKIWEKIKKE